MSIWTKRDLGTAGRWIERAVTNKAGYAAAAAVLGRTTTSIRLAHERGLIGDVAAKGGSTSDELKRKRETDHYRGLEAANKRLLDELGDARAQIDAIGAMREAKPIVAARKGKDAKQRTGTPVMLLSDLHIEEHVRPGTVDGANEYNLKIADECLNTAFDAYEWFLRDPRFDVRTGILALLGDGFSGHIHEELAEGNFLSPVEAVVWLLERYERGIRQLLANTTIDLRVVCCDGNHGRLTHKIRIATRTANSLEWLLYKTLAARFAKEPRVTFQIAEGAWIFTKVYGKELAFTHGDSFKSMGGVGGISVPILRGIARQFQGRDVHVTSMGHFHQRSDFGHVVVNGSMIGHSPFADWIHARPEPRQQSWFMVDSERGKSISAPIWLPQTGPNNPNAKRV